MEEKPKTLKEQIFESEEFQKELSKLSSEEEKEQMIASLSSLIEQFDINVMVPVSNIKKNG